MLFWQHQRNCWEAFWFFWHYWIFVSKDFLFQKYLLDLKIAVWSKGNELSTKRQKSSSLIFPKTFKINSKTFFQKLDSTQNFFLTAWNEIWENCWKKQPGRGEVSAPSTETFEKQKISAKNVIPKDAPPDIWIAFLSIPDEPFGPQVRK